MLESSDNFHPGLDEDTLRTVALVVCDPEPWKQHSFTDEQFAEVRGIVVHCLQAVKLVRGCEWMVEPLLELLKSVETKHWVNLLFRGELL